MIKIIEAVLLLTLPFLFTGIINKLKAIFVGKQGAPVLQHYYDFIKLIPDLIKLSEIYLHLFPLFLLY